MGCVQSRPEHGGAAPGRAGAAPALQRTLTRRTSVAVGAGASGGATLGVGATASTTASASSDSPRLPRTTTTTRARGGSGSSSAGPRAPGTIGRTQGRLAERLDGPRPFLVLRDRTETWCGKAETNATLKHAAFFLSLCWQGRFADALAFYGCKDAEVYLSIMNVAAFVGVFETCFLPSSRTLYTRLCTGVDETGFDDVFCTVEMTLDNRVARVVVAEDYGSWPEDKLALPEAVHLASDTMSANSVPLVSAWWQRALSDIMVSYNATPNWDAGDGSVTLASVSVSLPGATPGGGAGATLSSLAAGSRRSISGGASGDTLLPPSLSRRASAVGGAGLSDMTAGGGSGPALGGHRGSVALGAGVPGDVIIEAKLTRMKDIQCSREERKLILANTETFSGRALHNESLYRICDFLSLCWQARYQEATRYCHPAQVSKLQHVKHWFGFMGEPTFFGIFEACFYPSSLRLFARLVWERARGVLDECVVLMRFTNKRGFHLIAPVPGIKSHGPLRGDRTMMTRFSVGDNYWPLMGDTMRFNRLPRLERWWDMSMSDLILTHPPQPGYVPPYYGNKGAREYGLLRTYEVELPENLDYPVNPYKETFSGLVYHHMTVRRIALLLDLCYRGQFHEAQAEFAGCFMQFDNESSVRQLFGFMSQTVYVGILEATLSLDPIVFQSRMLFEDKGVLKQNFVRLRFTAGTFGVVKDVAVGGQDVIDKELATVAEHPDTVLELVSDMRRLNNVPQQDGWWNVHIEDVLVASPPQPQWVPPIYDIPGNPEDDKSSAHSARHNSGGGGGGGAHTGGGGSGSGGGSSRAGMRRRGSGGGDQPTSAASFSRTLSAVGSSTRWSSLPSARLSASQSAMGLSSIHTSSAAGAAAGGNGTALSLGIGSSTQGSAGGSGAHTPRRRAAAGAPGVQAGASGVVSSGGATKDVLDSRLVEALEEVAGMPQLRLKRLPVLADTFQGQARESIVLSRMVDMLNLCWQRNYAAAARFGEPGVIDTPQQFFETFQFMQGASFIGFMEAVFDPASQYLQVRCAREDGDVGLVLAFSEGGAGLLTFVRWGGFEVFQLDKMTGDGCVQLSSDLMAFNRVLFRPTFWEQRNEQFYQLCEKKLGRLHGAPSGAIDVSALVHYMLRWNRVTYGKEAQQRLELRPQMVPALGVCAATAAGDTIAFAGMYGLRQIDQASSRLGPMEQEMWHLNTGSRGVTATMFAVLLVESGICDFGSTLFDLIGNDIELHPSLHDVTVEMLVAGESGLEDNVEKHNDIPPAVRRAVFDWDIEPALARRCILAWRLQKGAMRLSGKDRKGTFNWVLLGHIIETIVSKHEHAPTLMSYEDILVSRFLPLIGVRNAGVGALGVRDRITQPRLHIRAERKYPEPVMPPFADTPPWLGPAARVFMPLPDYARYLQFHLRAHNGGSELLSQFNAEQLHILCKMDHDSSNMVSYCVTKFNFRVGVAYAVLANCGEKANVVALTTRWVAALAQKLGEAELLRAEEAAAAEAAAHAADDPLAAAAAAASAATAEARAERRRALAEAATLARVRGRVAAAAGAGAGSDGGGYGFDGGGRENEQEDGGDGEADERSASVLDLDQTDDEDDGVGD